VLTASGELDRKAVASIVFADPARRKELNAILHPRITALSMRRAQELDAKGEPLACYEAALIVENRMADAFRPLVVVAAPEEVQVARARLRDGAAEADARARIRAQMPLAARTALADFVIDNTGTLAELVAKTDAVLDAVCARANVPPERYPAPP
jgi:dephospho-CoA kinase